MTDHATYHRLLALLDGHNASYRAIDHPPEGATEAVSALRGHSDTRGCQVHHPPRKNRQTQQALHPWRRPGRPAHRRCRRQTVAQRSLRRVRRPGDRGAARWQPARHRPALRVHDDLELLADPGLLAVPTIYFNAARLDRSLALAASDYQHIAQPRIAALTRPAEDQNRIDPEERTINESRSA